MNQTTSPLTPASAAETSAALKVLFEAGLPFQRGVSADNVAMAYVEALHGASIDAIKAGIRKFLRGECESVSPKFVPTPPELARIVRTTIVPGRVPEARRIAPFRYSSDGERARMMLKVPMFRHAFPNPAMLAELDEANRAGMDAMILLAGRWGVAIPDELSSQTDADWRRAHNQAQAEISRNPPPYMAHRQRELQP